MESLTEKVKEIEKEEIIDALKESNWVMARAARKLGITERMIGYKIRKYSIQKGEVVKDGKQIGNEEQAVNIKKRINKKIKGGK
jgi:hypothetical protein